MDSFLPSGLTDWTAYLLTKPILMLSSLHKPSRVTFFILFQNLWGTQCSYQLSPYFPCNFTACSDFTSKVSPLLYDPFPKRNLFNSYLIPLFIWAVILIILWSCRSAAVSLNFCCYSDQFLMVLYGHSKNCIPDMFYHFDNKLFLWVIRTFDLLMNYHQPLWTFNKYD